MENFTFCSPTKMIFGKDTEKQVGSFIAPISQKILLCYGGGSIKKTGLYDKVVASLKEHHIEFVELNGIQPNPRLKLVKEGIDLCKTHKVEFILAVGGGSVIDTAKSIAAGVFYEKDVWDLFLGKEKIQKALPIGTILTIPATGSEASDSAVITNEDGWFKKNIKSFLLRPVFSILNPEITYTLPAYQTACGAADIMAHIMERYFTNVSHVDLTDRLCEATLKTIINNAPIALKNPNDYHARAEIMWAGTIAHNDLLGTGRIGDWASHKMEHELSGIYDIAHGAGLSIVFPAWMKYVYKHNIKRFVQFAVRVWDIDLAFESEEAIALAGIEKMTEFFRSLNLPVTLKDADIEPVRFEEMADKCTNHDQAPVGNFIKIYSKDMIEILNLAK